MKSVIDVAAPGVGTLLCFVARKALNVGSDDDLALIKEHLTWAITFDDRRETIPFFAIRKRLNNRSWRKKVKRQATGLLGTMDPLDRLRQQKSEAGRSVTDPIADLLPGWDSAIPLLVGVARREAREAIYRADLTTWTALLGNELTAQADEQLNNDRQARLWACIVTGDAKATPADGRTVDLASWGQAVALRFEISMMRDPRMASWVVCLDKHDSDAVLLENLRAAQGIRLALFTVAVAVTVVLPLEFLLVHVT